METLREVDEEEAMVCVEEHEREARVLKGLMDHVLPRVGSHVLTLDLSHGRAVSNEVVSQTPICTSVVNISCTCTCTCYVSLGVQDDQNVSKAEKFGCLPQQNFRLCFQGVRRKKGGEKKREKKRTPMRGIEPRPRR